jgi:SAM-dependent methyltransferase
VNDPLQIAEMFTGLAHDLGGQFDVVLDFGCGTGRLVEALERRGVSAFGADVADYRNAMWPMRQYFRRAGGGVAKIWRASPFKRAVAPFSRECRMRVLAQ